MHRFARNGVVGGIAEIMYLYNYWTPCEVHTLNLALTNIYVANEY